MAWISHVTLATMYHLDELTLRQRQLFEFIWNSIVGRGYAPSVREMCEHMNIKTLNGVMSHLERLEYKGVIATSSREARAIRIPGLTWSVRGPRCDTAIESTPCPWDAGRPHQSRRRPYAPRAGDDPADDLPCLPAEAPAAAGPPAPEDDGDEIVLVGPSSQ